MKSEAKANQKKRTRRAERQNRTRIVRVRLTEDEYNRLISVCKQFKHTVSEVLRALLYHGQIRPIVRNGTVNEETLTLLNDLIMQSKRIGNNINQIAHVANTTGLDDPILIESLNNSLGELHEWNYVVLKKAGEILGNH